MRKTTMIPIVLICTLVAPILGDPPPDGGKGQARVDVSMIAAWIAGAEEPEPFERAFGDSRWITGAQDAILYTDVEQVTAPKHLRVVPYDFVKPRMDLISNGHKRDPVVLITRSVAEDSKDGIMGGRQMERKRLPAEARYYYVEVGIGNMAWHWMKIAVYEVDGERKVEFLWSMIS